MGAAAGAAAKLDHVVRTKLRGSGASNIASAMGVQRQADGALDETAVEAPPSTDARGLSDR
jgi:hypothetical protein